MFGEDINFSLRGRCTNLGRIKEARKRRKNNNNNNNNINSINVFEKLATQVDVGKSLFEKTTFHMVIDLRRKKTNK